MKPYQLKDDEIEPYEGIYGYYRYLNGADTLVYTFTPADGSDAIRITKAVGVNRIDKPGETVLPALYEFYSVFPDGTLQEGISYDVSVQAYDRNNDAIEGFTCTFTLDS